MGFDPVTLRNQIVALLLNIWAWSKSFLPRLHDLTPPSDIPGDKCILISSPGGFDQLKITSLEGKVTLGYNIPGIRPPIVVINDYSSLPPYLVIVKTSFFSVNYADIAIRWGLYESALRYVGWPIVPGFDFSGEIIWAGTESGFHIGDLVFGFTLFGAYSSRILVPASQIRLLPSNITLDAAAAIPAVAGTALHAITLSGAYPQPIRTSNKAALVHSAAGGVGSMLVQMCRLVGYSPIVGVVGSSHKVDICRSLGADFVIDKEHISSSTLWNTIQDISPSGFAAIFDANGVSTLAESYAHLSRCGRLIVYGFHTNVPKTGLLSPFSWVMMIARLLRVPHFDPMQMVLESKAVMGFNLSFFADEHSMIAEYMAQIVQWIEDAKLQVPSVCLLKMSEIGKAHELIQSGKSVGKIVIRV